MVEHSLDAGNSILKIRPTAALRKEDFAELAKVVDPHIEKSGGLKGLIIEAPQFPGWDSFGALAAHLRFVREHHKKVGKVAVVTDSIVGDVARKLGSHFVAAEIRHFPAGEHEAARKWVRGE